MIFVLAFVTYAGVITRVPWLRRAGTWLRVGALDGALMASGEVSAVLVVLLARNQVDSLAVARAAAE